jgi:hypothetical protein
LEEMIKPACAFCKKPLRPYKYRASGSKSSVLGSALLAKIPTVDGKSPEFGDYGDNAICGLRCGYRFAVRFLSK